MAFKLIILSALLAAVANAGLLPISYQPHYTPLALHAKAEPHDYYAHPHYAYEYGVHDAHTGDIKSQHESRDGDVVKGSYSVVDPDGTKRTVKYTADDHNGFNAVVEKEPAHHHVAIKAVAPVAYHAAPYASEAYLEQAHQYTHHEPALTYAYHH